MRDILCRLLVLVYRWGEYSQSLDLERYFARIRSAAGSLELDIGGIFSTLIFLSGKDTVES